MWLSYHVVSDSFSFMRDVRREDIKEEAVRRLFHGDKGAVVEGAVVEGVEVKGAFVVEEFVVEEALATETPVKEALFWG
jgi:hypothetical protein